MEHLQIELPQYENLELDQLELPEKFPFPYVPESFTPEEEKVLKHFFTNTDKPVYALKNMDQEVAGALLSKYSRSKKSIRRVFLDDFYGNRDVAIKEIENYMVDEQDLSLEEARRKSKEFYDRVFGAFGDDSVIQMAGVHICFEGVSQIAAKAIEDGRIGASFIEKSTRYIRFQDKVEGHYLFSEVPEIMESEFADEFIAWNDSLFDSYSKHYRQTKKIMMREYPADQQEFVDQKTGELRAYSTLEGQDLEDAMEAYDLAIRAKVLDTIRVFLPTTTVTNLGAYLSGQAAEHMINKMLSSDNAEVRLLGVLAYNEASKVIPAMLSQIDHQHGIDTRNYLRESKQRREHPHLPKKMAMEIESLKRQPQESIQIVSYDKDADLSIATALLYESVDFQGYSEREIREYLDDIRTAEMEDYPNRKYSHQLANIIKGAVPARENRRHKLPRAFESAKAKFEAYADWGIFRDLQRNRMDTILRQRLSADDISIPEEFELEGMEEVKEDYIHKAVMTRDLHNRIKATGDERMRIASEYVTMFGNKVRFDIDANLRQWPFLQELRTIAGGHPTYRKLMQKAARIFFGVYPFMKSLVPNINWVENVGLGRLKTKFKRAGSVEAE